VVEADGLRGRIAGAAGEGQQKRDRNRTATKPHGIHSASSVLDARWPAPAWRRATASLAMPADSFGRKTWWGRSL
jgi:hypothetical protein